MSYISVIALEEKSGKVLWLVYPENLVPKTNTHKKW